MKPISIGLSNIEVIGDTDKSCFREMRNGSLFRKDLKEKWRRTIGEYIQTALEVFYILCTFLAWS